MTIRLLPGSPLAVPASGPDPWLVRLILRRTSDGAGRPLLPGLTGAAEELMTATLQPEVVERLGGPRFLPAAFERDRRRLQAGAAKLGYRAADGWAVEVDVTRGYRRAAWAGVDLGTAQ